LFEVWQSFSKNGGDVVKYPKKLIEVALPLDDINRESSREKSIRHGHPSTLHLWWARRPLAAARAVLFAQLVNDPGGERGWGAYPGQTREMAQLEREKLFEIIRELVKWENTNNEKVLDKARAEIKKSWEQTCKITGNDPTKLPLFLDPFAGGGSIPLEAQRLGLEAHASDLNPVAVMICKALIEIPPKFAGLKPVGPSPDVDKQKKLRVTQDWSGAKGLAEDVRRYGHWMREEAFKRIGHLYPQVELPKAYGGGKANVIAWLWARTVPSPNPAFKGVHVPLVKSFWLCNKKGKETWVEPVVADAGMSYTSSRFFLVFDISFRNLFWGGKSWAG
jgi:putative DNA methylase